MASRIRVFLDTSALFAGVWSATGGSRMILKLGEAGAVQLLVSSQVLAEIDRTLRQKAPGTLGSLALLLERCQASVVPPPAEHITDHCRQIVQHPGDAQVVAAAWGSQVEYFVTLDRKHFIENEKLVEASPFPIGTPGDFLEWFRAKLS